ncbi:MAG TPA: hypothetical protein EYG04_04240 [Candidatus Poseidoniales archaeon]|nr:hypothetical protein [Candidatus Poseidoniales archaeon]
MITTTLAGCLEDDEPAPTIVGEWYAWSDDPTFIAPTLIFQSNGTVISQSAGEPASYSNWSTNGQELTIADGDDVYPKIHTFALNDNWLFIAVSKGDACMVMSRLLLSQEDFISEAENLTLPTICHELNKYWNSPPPEIYQYSATDHNNNTGNGTADNLMVLEFVQAPGDLNWANIDIQITGADGVPHTCMVDGSTDCTITQYGISDINWEASEIIHLSENGADLCSGGQCTFDINITDARSGTTLTGTASVIVE